MNRRLVLASIAVVLLVGLAGCTAIFGGVPDEELDREAEYDDLRDSDADVAISIDDAGMITNGEFRAVYDLNETEELSLYRSSFYRDRALDVHGVRYWYPDNGTELKGSELEVDQSRSSTVVRVPDGNGTVAFSGGSGSRTFQIPAYVDGSYEVTLPEGYRTSNFLFGDVNPGGYEREVVDDQEHLAWETVDSTVALRYYLTRDVPLFAGLVVVVLLLGGAGAGYYYRQVKQLQEQREEMGLDIDIDDDSDDGPPPGLR
ncbi:DUF5803 family protein [Natronobacterium gregoryi]|uniref:Uncharacterized protein n=2 Tax=Natronobacterium gregoryi TaxID=44930 RepID=L0AF63_NATGS|nr:DUF5803 family protein [Natronobacterium gregoryi]AFZ71772.1 hypothetical protein Natgr_0519 [Natronobacterium gregoryi SP2]ELY72843.1 hypothetical protein C490_02441 [Natronobacterium gregoryi SP2]PLK21047.1 hypothetical protein CYV19_06340 [Natronobacterium gregoryi SP2]SFI88180.1 hypothetical protein SAMN05443661_10851 [Natronobacterium gregoryi]